jgi:cytochrome c oxidase assembly protein subunit 11
MSATSNKNRKVLVVLLLAVSGMFAFGYVLIPIYGWMRNVYGFGGAPASVASHAGQDSAILAHALNSGIDKSRTLTLQFVVLDNRELPAEFRPLINQVDVNPGEVKEVGFYAQNLSDKEMVVRAVPSVLPGTASKYVVRVASLDKEILKPHETKTMPLKIVVDRGVPKHIPIVTLSYQFIKTTTVATAGERRMAQGTAVKIVAQD